MIRFWIKLVMAAVVVQAMAAIDANPATAGFWTDLWSRASGPTTTAQTGQGIDAAAAFVKSLAPAADRAVLAAEASPEGHWRLVNRAGETVTAANPDELARALDVLAPELAGNAKARLVLYLTEETVFRHRRSVALLPSADLHLVVGATAYRLHTGAAGHTSGVQTAFAALSPRLVAGLEDRVVFDETMAQLNRSLAKAQIRIIALEPGRTAILPTSPRLDPSTQRAETDGVDPDRLRYALSSLRGQTALVTGRVDGSLLTFKPSSGPERSLLLDDIVAAAAASDVNLIVLHASSPRQPGARNWLWLKVDVQNLDTAIGHGRIADFLTSLTGDSARMQVTARNFGAGRVTLDLKPFVGASSIGWPAANPIAGAFNEILAEVTAKVPVQGITAYLRSSAREQELSRRIIPGIPSWLQISYAVALVAGLAGLPVARRWWGRLWPPEQPADYGARIGFLAAKTVRGLVFALLFLPLAGPLALMALPLLRRRQRPLPAN